MNKLTFDPEGEPMIQEYNRPGTIEAALALLARSEPPTFPLAGGTALTSAAHPPIAVVDLQSLGLSTFEIAGDSLHLGATLTLQSLLDQVRGGGLSAGLEKAIVHEATYNLRMAATVAGTLVASSGRSPFATALLALDALLLIQPGDERLSLGNLLPARKERLSRRLITRVSLPLNARLCYEYVARSPADQPIICAALAVWPSGRVRASLGGYGAAPSLVFDGTEAEGVVAAAKSACSHCADEWASAEYRQAVAGVLVERCLNSLKVPNA
jgi:CO/xanthine dehydrogenase FAD-binding subunit